MNGQTTAHTAYHPTVVNNKDGYLETIQHSVSRIEEQLRVNSLERAPDRISLGNSSFDAMQEKCENIIDRLNNISLELEKVNRF